MTTSKTYFLQRIEYRGGETPDEADVSISDYNFARVRQINVGKTRWVQAEDAVILPGRGSGTLVIGGRRFKIIYAWGGRNKPRGTGRTSHTVRLKGKNIRAKLDEIADQIILEEYGSLTYDITPFQACRVRSAGAYRKHLERHNEFLKRVRGTAGYEALAKIRPMSKREIDQRVQKLEKMQKSGERVTVKYSMDIIETDLLNDKNVREIRKKLEKLRKAKKCP